jgi:hypothetical protein
MRALTFALLFVALGLLSGCGSGTGTTSTASAIKDSMTPERTSATPAGLQRNEPDPEDGNLVVMSNPPSAVAPPAETERVVAEAGVGKQGRSLDESEGALVTPAKAYFSVRERVVFEVQIPKAISLYKATNGQAPQSHNEFMQEIVTANQIQLPALPDGHQYVYDVANEQLMVERPARN